MKSRLLIFTACSRIVFGDGQAVLRQRGEIFGKGEESYNTR